MAKICDKILQCLPDSQATPVAAVPKPDFYDSIHFAYQTGRLDLITVILGVVAIMLAMFAVFGFGYIRGQTYGIAQTEAKKTAEEQLKPILQKMEEQIKRLGDLSAVTRTTAPEVAHATEARETNENAV